MRQLGEMKKEPSARSVINLSGFISNEKLTDSPTILSI
jgi:hypothetical protein